MLCGSNMRRQFMEKIDTVEKPAKIQTISNRLASSFIDRLTSYQVDLSSNPRRDRTQQAITKS
jgi:hypothetical protein